jgi:hypothetical protein
MRNLVVKFFAICLISSQVIAQEDEYRERISGGLKAGLNLSNVYDSEGEDFQADAKLGFAGGAFLSIPIGKYLGVQPEILISQKGFQGSGRLLGSPYDFSRTTTFIDVPLMFAFKPLSIFTIVLGPQYSYLIHQKDVFSSAITTAAQETEFKNDNIRKNILCGILGVDFTVNHVVIGLRAGADFQKNNGSGTTTTPRYKNVWYQATIGFRL